MKELFFIFNYINKRDFKCYEYKFSTLTSSCDLLITTLNNGSLSIIDGPYSLTPVKGVCWWHTQLDCLAARSEKILIKHNSRLG